MDEQTSSTRIARGIQTHPTKLDDYSSFYLGLTQDFHEITGSISKGIFKSRANQQEIKSTDKRKSVAEMMVAKIFK